MKLVGAPARGDIDDRSGISSILCAEGGVIHSKFINSIDCGLERDLVLCNIAHLNTVNLKMTWSSRAPAELKENEPWPRSGAVRKPFCGGVTEPGISRARSTKCRPFKGISCTVR